jgi:signal transduction histidine kinase
MAKASDFRRPQYWLWFAGVTLAYVVFGKLGISLSVAEGIVTPVWAPSGLALAALLIFGRSLWPAVALGAFLTNATSGAAPLVAAAIACGNTLEPVIATQLLRKTGFRIDLARMRDVFLLVLLGAGLSSLLSATNGIAVLFLAGLDRSALASDWLLWWFGDAVGILMVTPLLLLAYVHRSGRLTKARALEAAMLGSSLSVVTALVFLGGAWQYPYLIFPPLLWAALRFQQLGAATGSFVVGVLGTWGTVVGTLPLEASTATTRVQLIQALLVVLAISLLVVGATLEERETALRSAEQTAARLSEAQALTHIGSWEWDLTTDAVTWSDELYRIFGLPAATAVSSGEFLAHVLPEDRARIEETVQRARLDRQPFSLEYGFAVGDRTRIVHSRGRVIAVDGSGSLRVVGTAQDVSEQRQAETLRADILSIVSHELRTPLASILNLGVTLRQRGNELDKPRARRMLDNVVNEARRIDRLLSNLLEIDRLRHEVVAAMREPTDVTQLLRQVADVHRIGDRPIAIEAEPMLAIVDGPKIERIVDNLLLNAVKHTPAGTPIVLRVQPKENDLLIIVDDDGPGIPQEHRTAIFEIFDRGPKAMSNASGAGIGLALVGRLAALHGGQAWVETSPSGGASMRVLIPNCVESEGLDELPMAGVTAHETHENAKDSLTYRHSAHSSQ